MHRFMIVILTVTAAALCDIPDHTTAWSLFVQHGFEGSARIEDVIASERLTQFRLLCTTDADGATGVWLLDLSADGTVLSRRELAAGTFDDSDWTVPRFLSGNRIVVACSSSPGDDPGLRFIDIGCPRGSADISLAGLYPAAHSIQIAALQPAGAGILMAGRAVFVEADDLLFAACADQQGKLIWKSNIGAYNCGLNSICLVPLNDGGCILSPVADGFPAAIPLYRLGSGGDVVWSDLMELECDLHAAINDFQEMPNGNIVCTGSYDPLVSDGFRGFTACLDSSGEELWRRTDWYLDHSSFTEVINAGDTRITLAGWMGIAGQRMLEVMYSDVLIALLRPNQDRIVGIGVEAEGDQTPRAVYPLEEGGFIVIGEHVPSNSSKTDIFLGRVRLET